LGKILIADDSVFIRNELKDILKNMIETEVVLFENGKDLVAYYKDCMKNKENIDLIIADTTMPIMNGFDALIEILNTNPAEIVIMCSELDKHFVINGIKLGAKHFISKPLDETQIKKIISRFINVN
jgi:two-component system, chemotaxis family, chemotaxis protein CheY